MRKRHLFSSLCPPLIAALCLAWFAPGPVFADSTADFNAGGLRFQLKSTHSGANYALAISCASSKANATPIVPTVFTLDKPARIVVDIPGFPALAAKTIDLSDGQFSAIRVGLHHDKTRLVLDVSGSELPQYSIENHADNEVSVALNFAATPTNVDPTADDMVPFGELSQEPAVPVEPKVPVAKEFPKPELVLPTPAEPEPKAPAEPEVLHAKLSPPEPKVAPAEETTQPEKPKRKKPEAEVITMVGSERVEPVVAPPKELPVEVIPSEPAPILDNVEEPKEPIAPKGKRVKATEPEESMEELPAEDSVKEKTKPSSGQSSSGPGKLSSFSFKVTDRPGKFAVQINVDGLGDYKLTRPKGDLYELVLQNTKLSGSHLTFPQFPPDEFQGFQAIAAVQRGEDVVVRIFVDDEVKLSPYRTEGQLWVQLSN